MLRFESLGRVNGDVDIDPADVMYGGIQFKAERQESPDDIGVVPKYKYKVHNRGSRYSLSGYV